MEELPRAKTFVRILEWLFWRTKLTGHDKSARSLSRRRLSTRGPCPKIGAYGVESSTRRQVENPVERAAAAPGYLDRCAFEESARRRKALEVWPWWLRLFGGASAQLRGAPTKEP